MTNDCTERCRLLPESAADRVAELAVSRLYLNPDQRYAGSCIVVARRHVVEITDLLPGEQDAFWHDVRRAAAAVQAAFAPHKLNVAMLGNLVPHLHAHVIARRLDDPAWPQAVWAVPLPPLPAAPEEKRARITALCRSLPTR